MGNAQALEARNNCDIKKCSIPYINDGETCHFDNSDLFFNNANFSCSKNTFNINHLETVNSQPNLRQKSLLNSPTRKQISNGLLNLGKEHLGIEHSNQSELESKCSTTSNTSNNNAEPTLMSLSRGHSSRQFSLSSTNNFFSSDYELNYIQQKPVDKLRQSYLAKLDNNNLKYQGNRKIHNSIIIFDWDDTLLCTSYLNPTGVFTNEDDELISPKTKEKLVMLDTTVFEILSQAMKLGETYIITNSEPGWVEYSAERFYPKSETLLKKIKIVSARREFEKRFPGDNRQWKVQAFLNMLKSIDTNLVTNLICLGDSTIEMEAAHVLASKFTQAFIKTVKFKESPKPNELNKQLRTVSEQFNKIYNSIKNLTIRVEKKYKF